ncbi:DUF2934 domain-containing protein [Shinella sp. CPCC 100929]|uniref:DUF2934 domain-containing protein n=1 Tax=Shinella lacus TaxID=2654216 RepID=A0ABT1R411_9HYPH|nr:DUF2934 domain-containing protein [Shinella lacus]MCQ4629919.1 DUF2934 domain-containing protein [Shinella lacus]
METDPKKRIRNRAYELWQAAGKPPGDGAEYWLQAEAEAAQVEPVIDADTPDAAARRGVEREHPETVVKVGGAKRKAAASR